jgi:hypothetical protein
MLLLRRKKNSSHLIQQKRFTVYNKDFDANEQCWHLYVCNEFS